MRARTGSETELRLRLAGAALCFAAFMAAGAPLIPLGGLGHDEAAHGEITVGLIHPDRIASPRRFLPWMKDDYQGPLKSFLLYPAFRLAGPGAAAMRWTTLALGAVSACFLALLLMRRCGAVVGGLAGLCLAVDPALVLPSVYDSGPAAVMLALRAIGLWCLDVWWRRERGPGALFAAGACFGLAVWDKAHFIWLLAALPLAALAARGRELLARVRGRESGAMLLGLAAGAFPFIVFNATRGLATFSYPSRRDGGVLAHFTELPRWLAFRARMLEHAWTGETHFQFVSDVMGGEGIGQPLRLLLWAAALLAAWAAVRRSWRELREPAHWLLASALVLLAGTLTPTEVKSHHFHLAAGFPELVVGSLAAAAAAAAPARGRLALRLAAAAFFAALSVLHVRKLSDFRAAMLRTRGSIEFYEGSRDLARWLDERRASRPGARFFGDSGFTEQFAVETAGRVKIEPLFMYAGVGGVDADATRERLSEAALERADLVLRLSTRDWNARKTQLVFDAAKAMGLRLEPLLEVPFGDGSPWAAVYELKAAASGTRPRRAP